MEMLPALRRDIEIIPLRHEGRDILVVRDAMEIAQSGLALSAEAVPLLAFFDGTRSCKDLQLAMTREKGGVIVSLEEIDSFVNQLERLGLLETESTRRARTRIVTDYSRKKVRTAALAGSAYPTDPAELAEEIDRILGLTAAGGEELPAEGEPRAVAAPHIDLRVSGRSYSLAYQALRSLSPPAILVLGTGHSLLNSFCLSDKSFHTPLGKIPAHREALRRFRKAGGGALASDDFAHRGEHSIEFQLLFLQRVFPMEHIPIVPLLCGPLDDMYFPDNRPLENPDIERFVGEIRRWLDEPPPGKLVVAGVDLSHVGPKFGDREPASSLESAFRASDLEVLKALEEGDADRLYQAVAARGNPFKVCGFSALWTLLAVLPGLRGKVLDYQVWHEEPTRSAVSFASLHFR